MGRPATRPGGVDEQAVDACRASLDRLFTGPPPQDFVATVPDLVSRLTDVRSLADLGAVPRRRPPSSVARASSSAPAARTWTGSPRSPTPATAPAPAPAPTTAPRRCCGSPSARRSGSGCGGRVRAGVRRAQHRGPGPGRRPPGAALSSPCAAAARPSASSRAPWTPRRRGPAGRSPALGARRDRARPGARRADRPAQLHRPQLPRRGSYGRSCPLRFAHWIGRLGAGSVAPGA